MDINVKDPLLFLGGMAVGAVISWLVTKKLCEKNKEEEIEQRVQEEVASVKETYGRITQEVKERSEVNRNKPDLEKYVNALMKNKPANDIQQQEPEPDVTNEEELMPPISDVPVMVSFGEFVQALNGYDKINIDVYEDNVSADDDFNVLILEDYIGSELVDYFTSEKDVDEICVRNDPKRLYINVAKDPRTFEEARQME